MQNHEILGRNSGSHLIDDYLPIHVLSTVNGARFDGIEHKFVDTREVHSPQISVKESLWALNAAMVMCHTPVQM